MNLKVFPEEVADGHLGLQGHPVVLTCRKETRSWCERPTVKTSSTQAYGGEEQNHHLN